MLVGGGFSFGGGDVSNRTWTRRFDAGDGSTVLAWLDLEWTPGPDLYQPLVGARAIPYAGGKTFLVVGSADIEYDGTDKSADSEP